MLYNKIKIIKIRSETVDDVQRKMVIARKTANEGKNQILKK